MKSITKHKITDDDVIGKIKEFFSDTSRSRQQTLDGLESIREEVCNYINLLEDDV